MPARATEVVRSRQAPGCRRLRWDGHVMDRFPYSEAWKLASLRQGRCDDGNLLDCQWRTPEAGRPFRLAAQRRQGRRDGGGRRAVAAQRREGLTRTVFGDEIWGAEQRIGQTGGRKRGDRQRLGLGLREALSELRRQHWRFRERQGPRREVDRAGHQHHGKDAAQQQHRHRPRQQRASRGSEHRADADRGDGGQIDIAETSRATAGRSVAHCIAEYAGESQRHVQRRRRADGFAHLDEPRQERHGIKGVAETDQRGECAAEKADRRQ
jgi:hypothetical protein